MFFETTENSLTTIRLGHGAVNAVDIELCDALLATLQRLAACDVCTSVVLTGNGRVFSAGIDLKRWLAESPDYVEPYMTRLEELFELLFRFPKPVVAAIEGAAIAGGCMLAAACDFRVIAADAAIGIVESRLGVPLPMMAIEMMRHLAVPSVFRTVVTTGATLIGDQAVQAGLADTVCDRNSVVEKAIESANDFSRMPPDAFQLTKRQIRDPVMRIVEENRRQLLDRYMEIWKSPATRNAIHDYVQNRLT